MPLVIFLTLAVFLALGLDKDPQKLPSALINKPLPVFKLTSLEEGQWITAEQWQGGVALVNIWATWCAPCRDEHPVLLKIAGQEGIIIYGINYKDKPELAREWLRQYGSPYRAIVSDTSGKLAIDLGVYGVPETFIIDKQGIIRYKWVGVLTEQAWQQQLKPVITELQLESRKEK